MGSSGDSPEVLFVLLITDISLVSFVAFEFAIKNGIGGSSMGMDFSDRGQSPKKFTGLAFVVFLHIFIVYALFTGLARKVVEVIAKPVETKIIEEVKPPPPPDLPPPPPPPKMVAPPPPFIPPPEVQVQVAPQANTIASTTAVKPEAPFVPPPRVPEHANGVRTNAVVAASACAELEYPARSLRNEETGVTTLALLVGLDGKVVDSRVEKSSGFKDLDNAARAGLSKCKFKPATLDGKPEMTWSKLQYVWKLD